MEKNTTAERIIKDLYFLLGLPKTDLNPDIVKYTEKEGKDEVMDEIKIPCSLYFDIEKYDYEGRHISTTSNLKMNHGKGAVSNLASGMVMALQSMRI